MSSLEQTQKLSTGLTAANLFVSYKSLKSLQDIKVTQERNAVALSQLQQIQREQLHIAEATLSEARKQSLLLERQEEERKLAAYEKERKKQLRDLVFRMNEEVDEIRQTSSSYAETYFRARALSDALDQSAIGAESFDEISDKVFWSGIHKQLREMRQINVPIDDVTLAKFISAVDRLFALKPPEKPESVPHERSIDAIEKENAELMQFIGLFDQYGVPQQKYVPKVVPEVVRKKWPGKNFHVNSDEKVIAKKSLAAFIFVLWPVCGVSLGLVTDNLSLEKFAHPGFFVGWLLCLFGALYFWNDIDGGLLETRYWELCRDVAAKNSEELDRFEQERLVAAEHDVNVKKYEAALASAISQVKEFEKGYPFLKEKFDFGADWKGYS